MPIYAYRCEDCGHAQDFLQKMSDPLIDTCPACGSTGFRKQLTAAGFQLKGGGWYVTDFRDGGKKDAKKPADAGSEGKSADSSAAGEGKSESKSDGKSDGKADSKSDSKSTDSTSAAPASTPATPAPAPSGGGANKAA